MNRDLQMQMMAAAITLIGFTAVVGVACTASRDVPVAENESGYGITDSAAPASYTVPAAVAPVEAVPAGPTIDPDRDPLEAGVAAYAARDWEEAVAYLTIAAVDHPDRGYDRYMLGLALWKAGELDLAADEMAAAVDLSPGFAKARINLSRIQNDREEFEAALEAARGAIDVAPEQAAPHFLEARSLRNLGRRAEAIASVERALAIDPGHGYARNLYGLMLLESGHAEQAVESLRLAAEACPEVPFIRNNLGMALERSGLREEAIAEYRKAVDLDPSHGRAADNLARLGGDGEADLVAGAL